MMTTKKTQKGRGKGREILRYAAFHETNLALCMAGGFLTARWEPSAARDHHSRSGGKILLSRSPVRAFFIKSARGDLDYGVVALAEIKVASASDDFMPAPLPIAKVRRVLFRTEEDRTVFCARVSGYEDVPIDIVKLEVEPRAFGKESHQLDIPYDIGKPPDHPGDSLSINVDKVSGALASLLAATRLKEGERGIDLLTKVLASGTLPANLAEMAKAISTALGHSDEEQAYLSMVQVIVNMLAKMHPREGFSPMEFIDLLSCKILEDTKHAQKTPGGLMQRMKDILEARADITSDAFLDVPGKIIPRALLLFLLNPAIERLLTTAERLPTVGCSVLFLSSFFAGCFSGLTSMPAKLKAPDRDAFLGLGLLAHDICQKEPLDLKIQNDWESNGNGRRLLRCHGFTIMSCPLNSPKALLDCYRYAEHAGLSPMFERDTGILKVFPDFSKRDRFFSVTLASSPTIPSEEAVMLGLVLNSEFSNKDGTMLIARLAVKSHDTGIFAREAASDKKKKMKVELIAYCPIRLLTSSGLKQIVTAIEAAIANKC